MTESAVEWPTVGLTLCVDGHEYPVPHVWIGDSLLAVLRERLDLDEPRDGCAIGECGACLVAVDGIPAASCLLPAVAAVDRDVRTPRDPAFDIARAAVIESGASPCGFCAPALAIAITGLLRRNPDPGPAAVREAMAGIVCRCSESDRWIEAVALAAEAEAEAGVAIQHEYAEESDTGPQPDYPEYPDYSEQAGATS
ncbi:MAG: (2Fe-2S)-binding protein [Catenulispora sp.]